MHRVRSPSGALAGRCVRPVKQPVRITMVGWCRRLSPVHLALMLGAVAVATVVLVVTASAGPWVTVNGQRETLPHPATVGAALRTAHVSPRGGAMYSAVTHRLLAAERAQLRVLLDGRPATLAATIRSGDRVQIGSPPAVEPLVAAYRFSTSPGLPDVERSLWHPGRSALEMDAVGSFSGEVRSRSIVGPPVAGQPETGKVVALTFDDGPDPQWTPIVLGILAQERVPATFCLVGIHVAMHPELARAELAQHETLCDHTLDHDEHLDRAAPARIAHEVNAGADAVAGATGVQPSFYRPPGGTLSPAIIEIAHQRGLRVLYWTIDSEDYLRPAPGPLLQRILAAVQPGAIILMHDGGGDRSHTVAILRPLIDTLRAEGYTFTTPAAEGPVATPAEPTIPAQTTSSGTGSHQATR